MKVDLLNPKAEIGNATVSISAPKRGFTPAEIAQAAYRKIVHVSDSCHPAIRDQMRDVEAAMVREIEGAIRQGIRSDRTTIYHLIMDAGHPGLAEAIRKEKV